MTETPLAYGCVPQSDFESLYHRIFEAAECRTQLELATFLGIRQSSISDAKRRKTIPSDWLIKLLEKKRISPEWVRTGIGGKEFQASGSAEKTAPLFVTAIERRPSAECTTDELLAELVRRALKSIG